VKASASQSLQIHAKVVLHVAESETHDLPREQKLALLKQLRKGLKLLHAQLLQAEAAPALQVMSGCFESLKAHKQVLDICACNCSPYPECLGPAAVLLIGPLEMKQAAGGP